MVLSEHATCLLFYCEHPILALGLKSILNNENDFILETCGTREEAVDCIQRIKPDIVLIDMNAECNLSFLQAIKRTESTAKIVLWVDAITTEMAYQAFTMGVRGIVRKVLATDVFLAHLRSIREGNLWIEKGLMNSIVSAKTISLTKRESQLVALLAQALKNKEIATTLNVTENTVKAYLSRLFQKLGVKDRLELALYGLKNLNANQNWTQAEQTEYHFPNAPGTGARSFQSILMQAQPKVEHVSKFTRI